MANCNSSGVINITQTGHWCVKHNQGQTWSPCSHQPHTGCAHSHGLAFGSRQDGYTPITRNGNRSRWYQNTFKSTEIFVQKAFSIYNNIVRSGNSMSCRFQYEPMANKRTTSLKGYFFKKMGHSRSLFSFIFVFSIQNSWQ